MSSLFAFVHHLAAFAFVAALVVEFVLLRDELTARSARKIQVAALVAGVAAGAVLAVGVLRVLYFEKGGAYYAHSGTFIAKVSLFAFVALLSIYPTFQFLSWTKAIRAGQAPIVDAAKLRLIRRLLHWELAGTTGIILMAALMARGVGFFG